MRVDHANIVFFLFALGICLLRLIGEAIGWGNVLFKGMPFLWLFLSLGFLFTWQVVFKGLEVYSVIFAWGQRSLSRLLQNIASGNWRTSVNWTSLIPLSLLAWPIRDLSIRWDIVHHRWAVSFPHYAQVLLHVAAVLYIVFIVIQGVYLVLVVTDTQTVLSYSHREQVQKYVPNLIFINIGLLMYDVIWIMTTLAIEGGEQYLLKILNLGCVGLVVYDICTVMALMKLQIAISSKPDTSIDCDDPSKTITLLRHLVSVFLFLSIAREFNSLVPSSLTVILPVSFLILGSVVVALKTYLLHNCLFTSIRDRTKEQPVYRITVSSVLMAIISIYSCLLNACQGYDSYHRWLSNEHPAFTAILAVYCTIYTVHIAYEGVLVVWQLSHPGCEREESIKRSLDITVLSACGEWSAIFTVYQALFVLSLPDAGVNIATLSRLCGPALFHFSAMIAYLHLKEKCYWSPKQAKIRWNDTNIKHKMVYNNQELKVPTAPSCNRPLTPVPHTNINQGLPFFLWDIDYIHRLWQSASLTMARYALSVLLLLAMLRWMLFGEVLAPFLPPWFMTRCYWYAYILVCGQWLLVMHRELHSLPVIKKCYSSIVGIVLRGDISKHPLNLCLGIVFLLVAALTILSIIFRASHSAHEWAGQRTVVLQIMVIPLLGIHVYAILLQGLLLYGAITATDSIKEATENSEVPVFAENLPKLKHINVVLLLDQVIFMFLSNGSVSFLSECPLVVFHVGSFAVIHILQHRGKELDKPRDEQREPEGNPPDPIAHCMLARWIPLDRTGVLMKLTAIAAVVRLAVKIYTFQGDWVIIVIFRSLTSLTFAVVNYYIYNGLTKQLARQHHLPWSNGIPTLILYITVGFFGIAEVGYGFYRQWTAEGDGLFLLDLSLTITALMNVALIIHEDILVIYLVSLDSRVEDKHCNLKQALQLVLYLNIFYAVFGGFSSFLAWLATDDGHFVDLLGHLTCAILVPTMALPVLERMYNDINKDLQCNEIGTNQEKGRSEQVRHNRPSLGDAFVRDLYRPTAE